MPHSLTPSFADLRAPDAASEWRRYWPLVLAATIGFSFMSFMTSAAGVFMGPLEAQFHWNRTQLSAGLALSPVLAILLSPFVGAMIDRFGVRRLALPGIVATALAVAAFARLSGSFAQWVSLWVLLGLCTLVIASTLWATAVAAAFVAARGLALGVTMAGAALAQVVGPPLANWLIVAYGWRAAFAGLGLGWGAIAFVLSLLFLRDVRGPSRSPPTAATAESIGRMLPGLDIAEALGNSALWRVAIATFLILTITIAVTVHQFPIITEAGVSRGTAAWLVSLSGVALASW
jgi:MFS family permease